MDQDGEETQLSGIRSIPGDIILDILSRLPITSLMQINLVCRSWCYNAQEPSLFPMHLSHAKQSDPCLVLKVLPSRLNEMYLVGCSSQNKDKGIVKKFPPVISRFQVVASCNGLLCLFESRTGATSLCNPFTKTCNEVPSSPPWIRDVLGFGANSKTKDYKILAYVSILDRNAPYLRGHPWPYFHRLCVLTIGSSTWRELGAEHYNFVWPSMQVLVNDRLHWTARPSPDRRTYRGMHPSNVRGTCSIISFDLADEQFREVGRPACDGLDDIGYQLVELRGCLSAAAQCDDGRMKIWVMKSYNVKESWVNEYVIGTYLPKQMQTDKDENYKNVKFLSSGGSLMKVLCLQKDNEIMFQYNCRALVSYNPESGTFTEHVSPRMPAVFDAIVYDG